MQNPTTFCTIKRDAQNQRYTYSMFIIYSQQDFSIIDILFSKHDICCGNIIHVCSGLNHLSHFSDGGGTEEKKGWVNNILRE
jgi:hypothetical protein